MEETPHLVTHFMAVGAEKRLEDYHFLRNTYETISGQEVQLNRILRMLGEDEIRLTWRTDFLPIGRSRNRFPYDFDRTGSTFVLQGSIAYERLRDLQMDCPKYTRQTTPAPTRRSQEFRERRRNWSEQRELPESSSSSSSAPSAARLRALAEFDAAMAESETKRQRQTEENRANASKNNNDEETNRRRDKLRTVLENDNQNERNERNFIQQDSRKRTDSDGDESETIRERQANRVNQAKNRSLVDDQAVSGTIDLNAFTVRCNPVPNSVRSKNKDDHLVRLSCQWAPSKSSSSIEFYTIERQLDDGEWQTVGNKIDHEKNQTLIDLSLLNEEGNSKNLSSHFRLKAHLNNGQTVTSQPTDEIVLKIDDNPSVIVPDVDILSSSSVQLSWNSEDIAEKNKGNENQTNIYSIEKKEEQKQNKQGEQSSEWEKVTEVPLCQEKVRIDSLSDASHCEFRLVPSVSSVTNETGTSEHELEPEGVTIENVNQLLNSLHVEPSSATSVDVKIEPEGFQDFNAYEVEYTRSDQPNKWQKVAHVTRSNPQLSVDNLKQDTEYQFRFTPVSSDNSSKQENNPSHLSLVLDVKTPSRRKGRFDKEAEEKSKTEQQQDSKSAAKQNSNINSNQESNTESKQEEKAETNDEQNADIKQESKVETKQEAKKESNQEKKEEMKQQSQIEPEPILEPEAELEPEVESEQEQESAPTQVPHFTIEKLSATSVLIEAVVPDEEPAIFEDVYDVYSKNETAETDWTKVGSIDKDHLSTKVENLQKNKAYAFKIDNATSASEDDGTQTVQEFKFETKSADKQFDPKLLMEKIEASLENVVNGVMQAAAGHQVLEEPMNICLNEVIKEVFRDEKLETNEEFGFDTLSLNDDLQLYRGPKQMMLTELEGEETVDLSKHYGEIIIHNYRQAQGEHSSVVVREENGNTRVSNIDGDIIIRNVVSDVTLRNEQTRHQLSMNIVGQAFLKAVQGTLIASKFKGIIVVKNVNKP